MQSSTKINRSGRGSLKRLPIQNKKEPKNIPVMIAMVGLLAFFLFSPWDARGETDEPFFVEIFLSADHKEDLKAIQSVFAAHAIKRVKAQFFRKGNPPRNIALGSKIPAPLARQVIDLAIKYNRGITHLLPEFRFFPHQIMIGSSAFHERVPVPIQPEDLERLRDPALTTPEFHKLYRQLTGERKALMSGRRH